MASSPAFAATPRTVGGTISTANTNRDGTGTIGDIFQGGTNGSEVKRLTIQATGTTTAGMIRLYTKISSTYYLIKEIPVDAITAAATTEVYRSQVVFDPPLTVQGDTYYVSASTNNAETFKLTFEGYDY